MTTNHTDSHWEALVLTCEQLMALPEYSTSVPTGQTIGKRWRRWTSGGWIVGEYQLDPDPKFVQIKWYKTRTPEQWHKSPHALIPYPSVYYRDPYGVITEGLIHMYARMVGGFVDGWHACVEHETGFGRRPTYWIVREYAAGIADIPDYIVQQIAMHYAAPCATRSSLHQRDEGPFHAIV